jgi:ubiquinone/menaquinone biosynthesis C-methylase UbiE
MTPHGCRPDGCEPDAAPNHAVPNHHAHHPGFSGPSGALAAVSFLRGRDAAAGLAIDIAGLQAGEHLVDVGCGPGVAVRHARAVGAEVIGVDPARVMLRVARVRWRRDAHVDWRIGSAESLPVDDGWAQVVWSLSTVHHWADLDRGLAEARRALRPGGRLVVLERRIDDPSAPGVAGHGWITEQAEAFAARGEQHGFVDLRVGEHAGSTTFLSVAARAG